MKFYIVDNGSKYLDNIMLRLSEAGHDYHAQTYSPFEPLDPADADMIILSGGMQNEVADDLENGDPWYRHEFALIQQTDKPILGICLGLQMIVVALGGALRQLPRMVASNSKMIRLTQDGEHLFGKQHFVAHEKHQWAVDDYANTGLGMLGSSEDGIEILYHPAKRIIGTQFHPEVDVTPKSKQLFWDLIGLLQPVEVRREA